MKIIIYTLVSLLVFMLFYYYGNVFKSQNSSQNEYSIEDENHNTIITINDLAGKTPSEIEEKLGKPISQEYVNPSDTPCPCPKYNYSNGSVEIVFIKGVSDWITINIPANKIRNGNLGNYVSYDQFEDYTYVKMYTK